LRSPVIPVFPVPSPTRTTFVFSHGTLTISLCTPFLHVHDECAVAVRGGAARLGGRPTSPPASTIGRTQSPAAAKVRGSKNKQRRPPDSWTTRRAKQTSIGSRHHAAGPARQQQGPKAKGPPT
jgi:hypothetical protein